MSLLSKINFV
jgi:hypothetical protein